MIFCSAKCNSPNPSTPKRAFSQIYMFGNMHSAELNNEKEKKPDTVFSHSFTTSHTALRIVKMPRNKADGGS